MQAAARAVAVARRAEEVEEGVRKGAREMMGRDGRGAGVELVIVRVVVVVMVGL